MAANEAPSFLLLCASFSSRRSQLLVAADRDRATIQIESRLFVDSINTNNERLLLAEPRPTLRRMLNVLDEPLEKLGVSFPSLLDALFSVAAPFPAAGRMNAECSAQH